MLASILPRGRIRCHSCRQARHCGSRLDRLQTLRRTSYGHSGYIRNRWLSANDLPPGAEGRHVSLLLQLPNVGRSKAGWRAMVRGRTKNACSEELQRFRRPLHRRNSVQHWNRICRKSSGSFCKSIRSAARSTDRSGCETAQIFSSLDSWGNAGIREPPNYSPEPTSGFFLTPMLARIWRRGGD